jgi:dienelactone hydrolase
VAATPLAPPSAKDLMSALGKRGPHRVLRGDLALAGLPGVVLTPAEGLGLPAVALAHGWMQPVARYSGTLAHLASWGIVVAAPATQRGPLPSHLALASDLLTALDICANVRLGPGEISVQPARVAVAGHGMGAGAAVLAAARQPGIKAVVGLAPAATSPSAATAAANCTMPGLFLAAQGKAKVVLPGPAESIAGAWQGPVVLRRVQKSTELGFAEGRHWSNTALDGSPERKTQQVARAMLTGFLLRHLTGDKSYDKLLSDAAIIPRTELVDPPQV